MPRRKKDKRRGAHSEDCNICELWIRRIAIGAAETKVPKSEIFTLVDEWLQEVGCPAYERCELESYLAFNTARYKDTVSLEHARVIAGRFLVEKTYKEVSGTKVLASRKDDWEWGSEEPMSFCSSAIRRVRPKNRDD